MICSTDSSDCGLVGLQCGQHALNQTARCHTQRTPNLSVRTYQTARCQTQRTPNLTVCIICNCNGGHVVVGSIGSAEVWGGQHWWQGSTGNAPFQHESRNCGSAWQPEHQLWTVDSDNATVARQQQKCPTEGNGRMTAPDRSVWIGCIATACESEIFGVVLFKVSVTLHC